MFRRRRPAEPADAVQPATLPPRWVPPVQAAVSARERYGQMLGSLQAGPVRDRVGELGGKVDAGVVATWQAAQRAAELDGVLRAVDIGAATEAFKAVKREVADARKVGAVPAALEQRAVALAERHASLQRLQNVLDDTAEQLVVLEARLEAAVAKVAELAFRPDASIDALGADLDGLVGELGALRSALDGLDGSHG